MQCFSSSNDCLNLNMNFLFVNLLNAMLSHSISLFGVLIVIFIPLSKRTPINKIISRAENTSLETRDIPPDLMKVFSDDW